ncbi:EDD domain protein, DegV family [Ignavigranum ruoffiae]|uniref:EDD domain protein, DegV family n=1 Tax=Ignavigranum ruoffiae TaxID=89093 RepID=A0A1H9G4K4_9LACT|nr:DegV family protein [Ignavigranum ruoffiae]SEQ45012.1 EDD domain protein, DegV family [Ignavigranum ruoffiae]
MHNIRIITDTAADITEEEAREKEIDVVSLKILFGQEEFIQTSRQDFKRFYELMEERDLFPTTSRPSPQDYLKLYQVAEQAGQDVLVLCLSGGLSGTVESAQVAKMMTDYQDHIEVIDTRQAILSQRLLVDYAVALRKQGYDFSAMIKAINQVKHRAVVFGLIDQLDYLRRGGRIPRSLAFLGQTLKIKPLIELIDGKIQEFGKKRGFKAAKRAMLARIEALPRDPNFPIYFGYTYDEVNARQVMEAYQEQHPEVVTHFSPIGGIIGSHLGPGGIGVAYVLGEESSQSH